MKEKRLMLQFFVFFHFVLLFFPLQYVMNMGPTEVLFLFWGCKMSLMIANATGVEDVQQDYWSKSSVILMFWLSDIFDWGQKEVGRENSGPPSPKFVH